MGLAVLISPSESLEVLPEGTHPSDVLPHGHLYEHTLSSEVKLYWSSSGYASTDINACATKAAGQVVKGDAFIVARSGTGLADLQYLLSYSLLPAASRSSSPSWPIYPLNHRRRSTGASHSSVYEFIPRHTRSIRAKAGMAASLDEQVHLRLKALLSSKNANAYSDRARSAAGVHATHGCAPAPLAVADVPQPACTDAARAVTTPARSSVPVQANSVKCAGCLQLGVQVQKQQEQGISDANPSTSSATGTAQLTALAPGTRTVADAGTATGSIQTCCAAAHVHVDTSDALGHASKRSSMEAARARASMEAARARASMEAKHAECTAKEDADACVPCDAWDRLDADLICAVAHLLPATVSQATSLIGVSRAWRAALMRDEPWLERLHFGLDPYHPVRASAPKHGRPQPSSSSSSSSVLDVEVPAPAAVAADTSTISKTRRYLVDGFLHVQQMAQQEGSAPGRTAIDIAAAALLSKASRVYSSTQDDEQQEGSGAAATDSSHATGSPADTASSLLGLSGGTGRTCRGGRAGGSQRGLLPCLLTEAARVGNTGAHIVLAQLHEVAGADDSSLRWWRRAAKGNDTEALFKCGMAAYQGTHGSLVDVEAAHTWLGKVVKTLLGVDSLTSIHMHSVVNAAASSGFSSSSAAAMPDGPGHIAPAQVASSDAARLPSSLLAQIAAMDAPLQRMLCRASLVLGYMAFDGEVVGMNGSAGSGSMPMYSTATGGALDYSGWAGSGGGNRPEAVRLFRLAAGCVCTEAQEAAQVLGWIFNTGQYG